MESFSADEEYDREWVDQAETSTPPPPPRANLGHLTTFCARGVGNLTFVLAGWGKLDRKCKVSNDFFFGVEVANSYKHVIGRDEEFKGRDIAIS